MKRLGTVVFALVVGLAATGCPERPRDERPGEPVPIAPEEDRTVPHEDRTVPHEDRTVPHEDRTVPEEERRVEEPAAPPADDPVTPRPEEDRAATRPDEEPATVPDAPGVEEVPVEQP